MTDTVPMNIPSAVAPLLQILLMNSATGLQEQLSGAVAVPPDAPATMVEAYRRWLQDDRQEKAKANTLRDHLGGMRAFDSWHSKFHPGASLFATLANPDLSPLRSFARWRMEEAGNAPTTIARRLVQAKMVLKAAVEAGCLAKVPEFPDAADLRRMERDWEKARGITRKKKRRSTGAVTLEECVALFRHADAASYPRLGDVSPGDFWRGLIRWHMLWGPRTQDVFAYREKEKTGILWSDVYAGECPDEELRETRPDLQSKYGWLYFLICKAESKEVCYLLLPLPQWQRDFIERFRGLDEERVFPLEYNHRKWGNAWNQIRIAAGVDKSVYPSRGQGGYRAMRKTAARWWVQTTKCEKLASYLLHHAEVTTAGQHYLDVMAMVVPEFLEHMDSFPLPEEGSSTS